MSGTVEGHRDGGEDYGEDGEAGLKIMTNTEGCISRVYPDDDWRSRLRRRLIMAVGRLSRSCRPRTTNPTLGLSLPIAGFSLHKAMTQ